MLAGEWVKQDSDPDRKKTEKESEEKRVKIKYYIIHER